MPTTIISYHLLATLLPFCASLSSLVVNCFFSLSLPWARVNVYLPPAGPDVTFYTMKTVDVALCVGRDPTLPKSIYSSSAVGGLRTFIVAGEMTMILLMLSFLLSSFSVIMSILKYSSKGSFGFRSQLLCCIGMVFLNFLGVFFYMILTVYQLHGSFYLSGMAVSAANVGFGLVCMIVSFLADAVIKMERQERQQVLYSMSSHQYGAVPELIRQQVASSSLISDEI